MFPKEMRNGEISATPNRSASPGTIRKHRTFVTHRLLKQSPAAPVRRIELLQKSLFLKEDRPDPARRKAVSSSELNMKNPTKITALTAVSAAILSALAMTAPAQASENGRKNAATALGAVTAYELLKGHPKEALLAGAATAVAIDRYQQARRDDDWRDRYFEARYDHDRRNDRVSERDRARWERERIERVRRERMERERREREMRARLERERREREARIREELRRHDHDRHDRDRHHH
jgi:hypothetical protein